MSRVSDPTGAPGEGGAAAGGAAGPTRGKRKKPQNDDEIIGIVIGVLATLILLLFILMIAIIVRQRRGKLYNNHRPVKVRVCEVCVRVRCMCVRGMRAALYTHDRHHRQAAARQALQQPQACQGACV